MHPFALLQAPRPSSDPTMASPSSCYSHVRIPHQLKILNRRTHTGELHKEPIVSVMPRPGALHLVCYSKLVRRAPMPPPPPSPPPPPPPEPPMPPPMPPGSVRVASRLFANAECIVRTYYVGSPQNGIDSAEACAARDASTSWDLNASRAASRSRVTSGAEAIDGSGSVLVAKFGCEVIGRSGN